MTIAHALKSKGYSFTTTRFEVFNQLRGQEPQTMHELIKRCAGHIDRASVYRTVALFEQLGIVHRLPIGWKYKLELSDQFHDHHHHMTCSHCSRTLTLPEHLPLEQMLERLTRDQGFVIQGHQLEIQGLCNRCQKHKTRSEKRPGQ